MLQPQIVEKPAATYAGLEASFISGLSPDTTNFKVIGPLWQKLFERVHEIPHRIGKEMYGIMSNTPESERTHPHEMQYLAGITVSSTDEIPSGTNWRTLPATTFAVFTHKGPIDRICDTVAKIYRQWLPQSDYEHSDIADIELYDHRFCHDSANSEMEYWISVRKKSGGDAKAFF